MNFLCSLAFTLLSLACYAQAAGSYGAGTCILGDESIMKQKKHGTSNTAVQDPLRWDCDRELADRICNFNRRYAERSGYWLTTTFISEVSDDVRNGKATITFYDSNTGKPLFVAPKGRTFDEFVSESTKHGWPSFRDEEVVWDNVRCLSDGETVSLDGTHLGHNLPDSEGNRYCINLVSVAGYEGVTGVSVDDTNDAPKRDTVLFGVMILCSLSIVLTFSYEQTKDHKYDEL